MQSMNGPDIVYGRITGLISGFTERYMELQSLVKIEIRLRYFRPKFGNPKW